MAGSDSGSGRQTRGRQRIPMKLIENQDDLYATFSKRRRGLLKKACELSTLCGVDLGIIIFSPTNNPFSLWNPSADSVVARYRNPRQLDELLGQKDEINEADKRQDEMDRRREKVWWEQVEAERVQADNEKEKWDKARQQQPYKRRLGELVSHLQAVLKLELLMM
ncbi:Agamous-like MADS-box protein AGL61 [Striga hermonthica]|uniref:Agamous-like MADS-box protein AGL61 n=1 Tax=Striga hermonthica TaxID=68872 RepID=A0A9N7MU53_STRHE|nr:Agamous-like MADS-box protein AGL61 [Striga hermonthica]